MRANVLKETVENKIGSADYAAKTTIKHQDLEKYIQAVVNVH